MSSTSVLVTLTVLEIVLLVLVLATYLIAINRLLRSIAANLAKVAFGVRAVEDQVAAVGPGATRINNQLDEILSVFPGVVERAERLAGVGNGHASGAYPGRSVR